MKRGLGLILLAASLVACSSSESPSPATTTSSTSTSTPTTTVTADPIDQLGADLLRAESAIRDLSAPTTELAANARAQQVAYRALVEHPEWRDRALSGFPQFLREFALANIDAGEKLRQLSPPKHPAPPTDWRIVPPAPVEELLSAYRDAEREFGVAWGFLAAIHLVETRMGRIRGESSAGAEGPMQFLPATWAAYGEGDINSNRDSIRAAARYLKRNGAPTNMRNALWNYNHSYLYVDAVTIYAEQMRENERAYFGYYHWQVYYRTTSGDVLLPEGYGTVQ